MYYMYYSRSLIHTNYIPAVQCVRVERAGGQTAVWCFPVNSEWWFLWSIAESRRVGQMGVESCDIISDLLTISNALQAFNCRTNRSATEFLLRVLALLESLNLRVQFHLFGKIAGLKPARSTRLLQVNYPTLGKSIQLSLDYSFLVSTCLFHVLLLGQILKVNIKSTFTFLIHVPGFIVHDLLIHIIVQ